MSGPLSDEKLQKVLARAGLGSRRELERWIEAGRVSVNGKRATVGDRVTSHDKVRVDGVIINEQARRQGRTRVLAYHKPGGEISARSDPEGRRTVFQSLPGIRDGRWVMVGRLDVGTSGLLLFTSNGELAHRLMHPSTGLEREYAVRVLGKPDEAALRALREGVMLDGQLAKFETLRHAGGEGANQWYHVTLTEGRYREVRRLWEGQGLVVSRLIRVRYGHLVLPKTLRSGRWVELDDETVSTLWSGDVPEEMVDVDVRARKSSGDTDSRGAQRRDGSPNSKLSSRPNNGSKRERSSARSTDQEREPRRGRGVAARSDGEGTRRRVRASPSWSEDDSGRSARGRDEAPGFDSHSKAKRGRPSANHPKSDAADEGPARKPRPRVSPWSNGDVDDKPVDGAAADRRSRGAQKQDRTARVRPERDGKRQDQDRAKGQSDGQGKGDGRGQRQGNGDSSSDGRGRRARPANDQHRDAQKRGRGSAAGTDRASDQDRDRAGTASRGTSTSRTPGATANTGPRRSRDGSSKPAGKSAWSTAKRKPPTR